MESNKNSIVRLNYRLATNQIPRNISFAHIPIRFLGNISYDDAMHEQEEEYEKVRSGNSQGAVFLLEHNPPVITFGKRDNQNSLLLHEHEIIRRGYQIRTASRGGFATVHEPGQAIVYFVVPIKPKSSKVFVSHILHLTSQFLLMQYGIVTQCELLPTGLWWQDRKLCFCGFDFSGGVSRHGIALNICNTMEGFSMIIPCGMTHLKPTSLSEILQTNIDCTDFLHQFALFLKAQ
ncbi:MAG: lipoyl(octanoyl) transferase [Spirochaetes bacterium]|nr:lipoyl(octanoyl) transferase [Spirochaetota bacterium]